MVGIRLKSDGTRQRQAFSVYRKQRLDMDFYRGKDIGDPEKLTDSCLQVIESGSAERIYAILPHISILRSDRFLEPLAALLHKGDSSQQSAAAMALSCLSDARAVEPLRLALDGMRKKDPKDSAGVQASVIAALGETGCENAVAPLAAVLEDLKRSGRSGHLVAAALKALGDLAGQGCMEALQELTGLLDSENEEIRVQSVNECTVAYWNRPSEISDTLLQRLFSLARQGSPRVRRTVKAGLHNLGELGSQRARTYLERLSNE